MLTRKHYYKAVAEILKSNAVWGREWNNACHAVASDLADYFQLENSNFDRERFMEACKPEDVTA